jgi:hypothetical protein
MTREQARFAAHGVFKPQCKWILGSQCINPDEDRDNIPDDADNATFVLNFLQEDNDLDFVGNVVDNCVNQPNADQRDTDGDHFGDVCDNCPTVDNRTQADADGDTRGDACDNIEPSALSDVGMAALVVALLLGMTFMMWRRYRRNAEA